MARIWDGKVCFHQPKCPHETEAVPSEGCCLNGDKLTLNTALDSA